MNDMQADAGHSAGSMLRAAREKQGLHIAALAAAIKVAPRKLDALENDRWNELPDAAFTRALAQTVCRTLKLDPVPVLALLPSTDPGRLDTVSGTLNTPFNRRGGRSDVGAARAVRPMVLAGVLLLVAAVVVWMLPAGYWESGDAAPQDPQAAQTGLPAPVVATASAAVEAASAALHAAAAAPSTTASSAFVQSPGAMASTGGMVGTAPLTGATGAAGAAALPVPPASSAAAAARVAPDAPAVGTGAGPVKLRAVQATWVSARDASGAVLLSRLLAAGESVALDGAMPVRLTIGNAAGTELDFRGQKIDLVSRTKDNVARLELQ